MEALPCKSLWQWTLSRFQRVIRLLAHIHLATFREWGSLKEWIRMSFNSWHISSIQLKLIGHSLSSMHFPGYFYSFMFLHGPLFLFFAFLLLLTLQIQFNCCFLEGPLPDSSQVSCMAFPRLPLSPLQPSNILLYHTCWFLGSCTPNSQYTIRSLRQGLYYIPLCPQHLAECLARGRSPVTGWWMDGSMHPASPTFG